MTTGARRSTLAVGDTASQTRRLTDDDVMAFASATGDWNPLHTDDARAAKSRFGRRVVHGLLVASLISVVIAERLPGPGSVYVSQDLRFLGPVFPGDTVTAAVVVLAIADDRVRLLTSVHNQVGQRVLDGEAVVLSPRGGQ